jgi:protein-S-isoprenylcysteine O-methyltransferase
MPPHLNLYFDVVWTAVFAVWLVCAARTKRPASVQSKGSRSLHLILIVAAFLLVFRPEFGISALGHRFLPAAAAYAGLALTVAGAAFAVWARLTLGRNWSAAVTIKEDHRIIRTGPYALVRHPIYSGFLLALLGTGLAVGEVRCLVGVVLAFVAWWTKSRLEERVMERQFGVEYIAYKQDVKALIPFLI